VFCTWVLFLSLGDTKGRDDLSNGKFRFLGEDGVGGSGPSKRLYLVTPTAILFLPAVLNTVAQQEILKI